MSMYKDYCLEREGKLVLEDDKGFAAYLITGDECYIVDIYIAPEHRRSGHASYLADEIAAEAKAKGCKILTGSVDPRANGATESLKTLLAYGMRLHSIQGSLIYFLKEI